MLQTAATTPGFIDRTGLTAVCNATEDGPDAEALCLGYITGSVDQLLSSQARRPAGRRTICLPTSLSPDDVRMAIVAALNRMAADPSVEGESPIAAASVIRRTLEATYPCVTVTKLRAHGKEERTR